MARDRLDWRAARTRCRTGRNGLVACGALRRCGLGMVWDRTRTSNTRNEIAVWLGQ